MNRIGQRLIPVLALLAFAGLGQFAQGGWLDDEPEFLSVDEAFVLSVGLDGDGALVAKWAIADGYYLYRHRFGFKAREGSGAALGEMEMSPGKAKVDEYFGEVEVYYHDARARLEFQAGTGKLEVGISYQGCAEAGLCYPPQTRWVSVDPETGAILPAAGAPAARVSGSIIAVDAKLR